MMKLLVALLFVSCAVAVTPDFGEYVVAGLKIAKDIFSHSKGSLFFLFKITV
jgi:hypothetical protein